MLDNSATDTTGAFRLRWARSFGGRRCAAGRRRASPYCRRALCSPFAAWRRCDWGSRRSRARWLLHLQSRCWPPARRDTGRRCRWRTRSGRSGRSSRPPCSHGPVATGSLTSRSATTTAWAATHLRRVARGRSAAGLLIEAPPGHRRQRLRLALLTHPQFTRIVLGLGDSPRGPSTAGASRSGPGSSSGRQSPGTRGPRGSAGGRSARAGASRTRSGVRAAARGWHRRPRGARQFRTRPACAARRTTAGPPRTDRTSPCPRRIPGTRRVICPRSTCSSNVARYMRPNSFGSFTKVGISTSVRSFTVR